MTSRREEKQQQKDASHSHDGANSHALCRSWGRSKASVDDDPWRFFPVVELLRLEAPSTAAAATTTSVHPASPSTTASTRGVLLALAFWLGRVIDKQGIEGECIGKYEVPADALGNMDQRG